MGPANISLLEPPYRDFDSYLARLPVLGGIAVGRCGPGRDLTERLTRLLEAAPWAVPCIALTADVVTPLLLQSLWSLPAQPAFVVLESPHAKVSPAAALTAVAGRPAPTAALLIAYVVRRTHSVMLGETLEQVWRPRRDLLSHSAERTVRYRLRQHGLLSRLDWVRVRRLIRVKTEGRHLSVERQAELVGAEARTLRAWVGRYLGVTMPTFRLTAGWEWILEIALRQGEFRLEGAGRPRPTRLVADRIAV